MKLNIIYPIWGSEHLSLETFIGKVKEAGYDGIEMNVPFDNQYTNRLQKLLDEKGLLLTNGQSISL